MLISVIGLLLYIRYCACVYVSQRIHICGGVQACRCPQTYRGTYVRTRTHMCIHVYIDVIVQRVIVVHMFVYARAFAYILTFYVYGEIQDELIIM